MTETTNRLVCPERHAETDPPGLVSATQEYIALTSTHHVIAATIEEGRCPACPARQLRPTTVTLYGQPVEVGECPCCDARWRISDDGWEAIDIGRLEKRHN